MPDIWCCTWFNRRERVAYVNSIISGETKEIDNDVFNGYMDTFDLLAEYNYNKADPLVGDVNMGCTCTCDKKHAVHGLWVTGHGHILQML